MRRPRLSSLRSRRARLLSLVADATACMCPHDSWHPTVRPVLQERAYFYQWRRELASLEQDERLVLTPFEKNLEVWRQLWRVLERSDVIVQVVDARDPLTYRSEDLERYALEMHPAKSSLLLLNKADLLPEALRSAWADYFDGLGVDYAFWSAKAGMDEHSTGAALTAEGGGGRASGGGGGGGGGGGRHGLLYVCRNAVRGGLPYVRRNAVHERGAVQAMCPCVSRSSQIRCCCADDDFQAPVAVSTQQQSNPRTRMLKVDELLSLLRERAARAAAGVEASGIDRVSTEGKPKPSEATPSQA